MYYSYYYYFIYKQKTVIDDNGLKLPYLLNGKNKDVMTFLDIIQTIEKIKNDDRITGKFINLNFKIRIKISKFQ